MSDHQNAPSASAAGDDAYVSSSVARKRGQATSSQGASVQAMPINSHGVIHAIDQRPNLFVDELLSQNQNNSGENISTKNTRRNRGADAGGD